MTQLTAEGEWNTRSARVAGVVLIAAPLLEILAMVKHPSVHAHAAAEAVAQVRAASALAGLVHGVLIALMVALVLALVEFSVRRGMARPLVRAGLTLYGLGVIGMTAAALVSGFVASNVPHVNPGVTPADQQQLVALLLFAMLFNQAFAKCGALLMSAGILGWSLDLSRQSGLARVVGYFGILSSLGCALALALGLLHLDVPGMTAVVVLQALWTLGAGVVLLGTTGRGPLPGRDGAVEA